MEGEDLIEYPFIHSSCTLARIYFSVRLAILLSKLICYSFWESGVLRVFGNHNHYGVFPHNLRLISEDYLNNKIYNGPVFFFFNFVFFRYLCYLLSAVRRYVVVSTT